jgi:S1-C subfamily serine protease
LTADTETTLRTFGLEVIRDTSGALSGISGQGAPMWHQSGLQPTDVIVAIDGRPIAEVLQEPYALDRAALAAVTTLKVLRAGNEISVEAKPQPVSRPLRRRQT